MWYASAGLLFFWIYPVLCALRSFCHTYEKLFANKKRIIAKLAQCLPRVFPATIFIKNTVSCRNLFCVADLYSERVSKPDGKSTRTFFAMSVLTWQIIIILAVKKTLKVWREAEHYGRILYRWRRIKGIKTFSRWLQKSRIQDELSGFQIYSE